MHAPDAGEVAWDDRRRAPLPPALSRSHRQSRIPARCAGSIGREHGDPRVLHRARIPRGRDAFASAHRRRCGGAPVHHASQHARHRPVPARGTRALSEALAHRWARARLRAESQLPERGRVRSAQSGVHDARGLRGVRRLQRHDVAGRGPRASDRPKGHRLSERHYRRRLRYRPRSAVRTHHDVRCDQQERRAKTSRPSGIRTTTRPSRKQRTRMGAKVDPKWSRGKVLLEIFEVHGRTHLGAADVRDGVPEGRLTAGKGPSRDPRTSPSTPIS